MDLCTLAVVVASPVVAFVYFRRAVRLWCRRRYVAPLLRAMKQQPARRVRR